MTGKSYMTAEFNEDTPDRAVGKKTNCTGVTGCSKGDSLIKGFGVTLLTILSNV